MAEVLRTKGFREKVGRVVFAVYEMVVEVATGMPLMNVMIENVDMV